MSKPLSSRGKSASPGLTIARWKWVAAALAVAGVVALIFNATRPKPAEPTGELSGASGAAVGEIGRAHV